VENLPWRFIDGGKAESWKSYPELPLKYCVLVHLEGGISSTSIDKMKGRHIVVLHHKINIAISVLMNLKMKIFVEYI
jgi:hypothetical protein